LKLILKQNTIFQKIAAETIVIAAMTATVMMKRMKKAADAIADADIKKAGFQLAFLNFSFNGVSSCSAFLFSPLKI